MLVSLSRDEEVVLVGNHVRVLKSEIEIGPVHHRLPDRIRAHASVCFLALILCTG